MVHKPYIAVAGAVEHGEGPGWVTIGVNRSAGRQAVGVVGSLHEALDHGGWEAPSPLVEAGVVVTVHQRSFGAEEDGDCRPYTGVGLGEMRERAA